MTDGREPEENRLIAYAAGDGKIYDLGIMSFVVMKTVERVSPDDEEVDLDVVAEATGRVAADLIEEGWFNEEEYVASAAAAEVDSLLEDLGMNGQGTS